MLVRKALVWTVVVISIGSLGACGGSSSSGAGNTGDFCNALKLDAAKFKEIGDQANQQQVEAALNDLANKAPSEIKADMAALVQGVKVSQSFASALSADPSNADSLESSFSGQEAAFTAASAHIEAFAKDKCGIDLNSDSSST